MHFRLLARLRSVWRDLRRRGALDAELSEEFRHHLELRTEDLIRQGVPPRHAARRARVEFGHVESLKEEARASRGLRWLDQLGFSWLDIKLGARMLRKYPGLSVVSVIGMSVAIAISAGGFGLIHALVDAPLPLPEGDRVVSVQNSDARIPGSPDRRAVHDFVLWRNEVRSLRDLSAFREEQVNLVIPGGATANVSIARMTSSGFRVARVAPVLGRPLLEADEQAGATPVVVIGYEEWQRRFAGDPAIIGRAVLLDTVEHTVVGVMPEHFRFPVDHRYWTPLRLNAAAHQVGAGPEIMMFARLADGAALEQAQAELTTIGGRLAAAYPETHAHLRPWVRPYTHPFVGIDSPARAWLLRSVQVGLSLLLVVVSVNVAALVYARTVARIGEIAVRTALGASRRRVVTQLFAEALVLSLAAAVVGITMAALAFDTIRGLLVSEGVPFWVDLRLSPPMLAYVAALVLLTSAIVGAAPALKATGRSMRSSLQHISSRASRMQLGRAWTALIVMQVAVAVAILPYSLYAGSGTLRRATDEPDYAIDEFLQASVGLRTEPARDHADSATYRAALSRRFVRSMSELLRRLSAEPSIADVAFATSYPGSEASVQQIEVEGTAPRQWVWSNRVDTRFFDVFGVPILAGRAFADADASSGSNTVIVDRAFVDRVLGGGAVTGRRVRLWRRRPDASGVNDPGPWLEVVGVVPAFTPPPPFERAAPKLYQPMALADAPAAVQLAVRTRRGAAPATVMARVREIAHAVDGTLQIYQLQTASEAQRLLRKGMLSLALGVLAITGSVLLLSAAGISAMMSFTVASRRREIGIRAALGAAPRRVLAGIFRRAGAQLGAGVLGGVLLAQLVAMATGSGSLFSGEGLFLLPLVALIMGVIGLLAALGPARRGLSVQPTEALRQE